MVVVTDEAEGVVDGRHLVTITTGGARLAPCPGETGRRGPLPPSLA
jgi:hypothetical protein